MYCIVCVYAHTTMACSFTIMNIMFVFVSVLAFGVPENASKPYECNFQSQFYIFFKKYNNYIIHFHNM